MTSTAFQGVIFDMDGVLANTAQNHLASWHALAEEEGFSLPDAIDVEVRGVERMASLHAVLAYSPREYSPEEKDALANRKNDLYLQMLSRLGPEDLLPGVSRWLSWLAEADIRVALASSSRNARLVLTALGIIDRFHFIADAARARHPKPHPEIYLMAAEGLGLPPEACMGVEDAVYGIDAIQRAGMYALGVGEAGRLARADAVVPSLAAADPADFIKA